MLHKKLTKQNEEGFTIIEVLIVLAIAALILLIVFLAVPALQRSQRNNSRKNDASRVSTSLANFAGNNNGSLPGTVNTWAVDCPTVAQDVGALSQFGDGKNPSLTDGTAADSWCNNGATAITAAQAIAFTGNVNKTAFSDYNDTSNGTNLLQSSGAPTGDQLVFASGEQCGTVGASFKNIQGNSRQSALVYTIETNGGYSWACINVT